MRIPPQVSERVKEAPAQALRAVFSGIGQVLLVADRIRSRAADPTRVHPAETRRDGQNASAAPKDETRWRSLDETGNVRLLSEDDDAPERAEPAAAPRGDIQPAPPAKPPAAPQPAASKPPAVPQPAASKPPAVPQPAAAREPAVAAGTVAGPDQATLPVPNYDDLTLASLRARLRNLDSTQVRLLLDYEKANAGRADVLTMYERRIAKLENGPA